MKPAVLLIIALLVPCSLATGMDVNIAINRNDIVSEDFRITSLPGAYDSFEFATYSKPFSIRYDGEYKIAKSNDSYTIVFDRGASDELSFTLFYDGLAEKAGSGNVFRVNLAPQDMDNVSVRITLPEKHVLSGQPSATPMPGDISTDGQHIILSWEFSDPESVAIAVFYQGEENSMWLLPAVLIAAIAAIVTAGFYFRKRAGRAITETLSDDERLVVGSIQNGIRKQKEIARSTGFSKSKMSKLIRKLEEKGLVEKTPFFKTNKLKLKKI